MRRPSETVSACFVRIAISCALAMATSGCANEPAADVRDIDADLDASAPRHITIRIPYVSGAWQRVYAPSNDRYLNDHTVVFDGALWHVIGITNTGEGQPQTERRFLHATAPSLFGPWMDRDDVLVARADLGEQVLWAPFAFRPPAGGWQMHYWADDSLRVADGGEPLRGLRVATSTNLYAWQRVEATRDLSLRPPGGRDPFVLRVNNEWLLYSVGASSTEVVNGKNLAHGRILVSHADDPGANAAWSDPAVVLEDADLNYGWGNLESPYVLAREEGFYLFLTRTNFESPWNDYMRTLVFFSIDPRHFAWPPITELRAHAAEVVTDADGVDWITSAGWTGNIGVSNRGLSIARLEWAAAPPRARDP